MATSDERPDPEELTQKIRRIIRKGRVDETLTEIIEEAIHRQRFVRARAAYDQVQKVEPGDRIVINKAIRPRYLGGKTGTIRAISRRTRAGVPMVEVELDRPVGKYHSGMILLHGSSFELTGAKEVARMTGDGAVTIAP